MNTIGFIGLGLMGEAMSKNIVSKFAGTVVVYDLNPDAVNHLVKCGALAAASIYTRGKSPLICRLSIHPSPLKFPVK
jgi:3-hydroxyisobutyrate dehydrogenase-like beta-hydroxyacid dehydrogenase